MHVSHFEPPLPSHPDPAPQQLDGVASSPLVHTTGNEPPEHVATQVLPLFKAILQDPLLRKDWVESTSRLESHNQLPLPLMLLMVLALPAMSNGRTQPVQLAEPASEALPSLHRRQLLAWMRAVRGW